MQPAGLGSEEILPDPEQRPRPCRPQGQGSGEAGGGGQVGPARRVDLVQRGAGNAAAQRFVQRRHAEVDALHRRKIAREPRQSEALPEAGQGAGRSIGHEQNVHYLFLHKTTPKPRRSQARICGMPPCPRGKRAAGAASRRPNCRQARRFCHIKETHIGLLRPSLATRLPPPGTDMSSGLFALLDDIAGLAKVAAAALDDAATQATKAGAKAAGIVIDDAAVTPRYAVGFAAERELPIIWRIALGSLKNKLLFLLPAALVLSFIAPWAITPLLMAGGAYLCFEGFEKVYELVVPHADHGAPAGEGTAAILDATELEQQKISGAIKTDFILSAEIMAITLATVTTSSYWMQALVLAVVGLGMTMLVYGAVALIVKADDAGAALARTGRPFIAPIGRGLVLGMPHFLKALSAVGTAAMLWVGGGIIIHGLAGYGLTGIEHAIHGVAVAVGQLVPALSGLLEWLTTAGASAIFGLAVGGLCLVGMHVIVEPVLKAWRGRAAKTADAAMKK